MLVLALDLATKTGWCLGEPGQRPAIGTFNLASRRAAWTSDDRSFALGWALRDLFKEYGVPTAAAIEATVFMGPKKDGEKTTQYNTTKGLDELNGAARAICGAWHIPTVEIVPCGTWRKHFIGKASFGGRDATKLAAFERAQLLGHEVKNDNESDAVGIWDWMVHVKLRQPMKELVLF